MDWVNGKFPVGEVEKEGREKSDNPKCFLGDLTWEKPSFCAELDRIRVGLRRLEAKYRQELHSYLLAACGAARQLRTDVMWGHFITMDWGSLRRPKAAHKNQALRHVLRYICGPTKEGQQKASFYYRALGPLLKKGHGTDELKKALNEKGLRRLADSHSKSSKHTEPRFVVRRRGKKWVLPAEIYFDRDPVGLPDIQEHMNFTMVGIVTKVGERLGLLVYSFG